MHYAPEIFKMWSLGLTLLQFDNSNSQKMSFSTTFYVLIFYFSNFEQFFWSQIYQIYQNSKFRVSLKLKKGNFCDSDFAKIDFLNFYTETEGFNFTFLKILEHSAIFLWMEPDKMNSQAMKTAKYEPELSPEMAKA